MRSPIRFIISFKFKGWLLPFVLGMVVLPFLDGTSTIAAQSSRIFTDAVAWSPDGNLIAYGTGPDNCSGCVRFGVSVMNVATGAIVRTLDAGGSVYALDWSPDGTRLAAAVSTYELFRIWSMTTGQLLAVGTLGGQGGVDVRWRPNSNELAVTGIGNEAAAFDATSGNLLRALPTWRKTRL